MTIKFFYNGLKVNGGKLQAVSYSKSNYTEASGINKESITMYKKYTRNDDSTRFSKEVGEFFKVKNDSDGMSDYFENDRIVVSPEHPLYPAVLAAWSEKQKRIAA